MARHAANGLDSSLHALHVVESAGEELPAYDIAVNGNIMSFARADSGTGHGQRENAKANYHGRQLSAFAQHVDELGNDLDVRAGTAEDVIADFSV